jgi:hypothetical protein
MRRTLTTLKQQDGQHRLAVARWESLRAQLPEHIQGGPGDLTICSVAYRAKACLDFNERLIRELNPGVPLPPWLLFDNNVEPKEMIDPRDSRFTVVRDASRDIDMGYEHALGISALLSRVKTRFLLVLDPDCFVVLPEWLRRVPAHMIARQLGFFGTPMNPRRHNSYRYFPYMVCMFVDLARVSPRDLCFLPGVWEWRINATYRMRKAIAGLPKAGAAFRWLLTEQWRTNGWQIKRRFGRGDEQAFECAQAVWDVEAATPRGGLKGLIHALTPASVSPIPSQTGYCSPIGFASMGAPDVAALGWEEFVWRGEPFAFHIGSVHSSAAGPYEASLPAVVDAFARRGSPAEPVGALGRRNG